MGAHLATGLQHDLNPPSIIVIVIADQDNQDDGSCMTQLEHRDSGLGRGLDIQYSAFNIQHSISDIRNLTWHHSISPLASKPAQCCECCGSGVRASGGCGGQLWLRLHHPSGTRGRETKQRGGDTSQMIPCISQRDSGLASCSLARPEWPNGGDQIRCTDAQTALDAQGAGEGRRAKGRISECLNI